MIVAPLGERLRLISCLNLQQRFLLHIQCLIPCGCPHGTWKGVGAVESKPRLHDAHYLECSPAHVVREMGRVSKHKRIKACDPFYKGPRRIDPKYVLSKIRNHASLSLQMICRCDLSYTFFPFLTLLRNDDLPPETPDDQPMPKTLSRLLKSGQQISTQASKSKKKPVISSNSQKHISGKESAEYGRNKRRGTATKQMDDAHDGSVKNERRPMLKRQRGESLKAYLERIDVESNERMMEAFRKSRKQSDRRKRYIQR